MCLLCCFCLLLLHSFCLSPVLFIFFLCMPASLAFSCFFSSSSVLHPSPSTKSSSHLWLYPLDDKIKAFSYFQGQTLFFPFNVESTTGLHSYFSAVCLAQFRNASPLLYSLMLSCLCSLHCQYKPTWKGIHLLWQNTCYASGASVLVFCGGFDM